MTQSWMQRHGWQFVTSLLGTAAALLTAWIMFYGQIQVMARDVEDLNCRVPALEEKVTGIDKEVSNRLTSIDEQLKALNAKLKDER